MGSANIKLSLTSGDWVTTKADGLLIPVFEETGKDGKKKLAMTPQLRALEKALQGELTRVAEEEKFKGSKGRTLLFRKSPGDKIKARRVVLVGMGDSDKLSVADLEKHLLRALAHVTRLDKPHAVVVALPAGEGKNISTEQAIITITDVLHQGIYRSGETKSKGPDVKSLEIYLPKTPSAEDKKSLQVAGVIARARSFAKDLVNKPSNLKTTDTMTVAARGIGKSGKVKATVVADKAWIEKTMPCFYEVARGSVATDPPKWITLTYKPKGAIKKKLALVGKSVMFETGGYQVKTGNFMNTMKGDMTGGAVVLATMQAIAELAPPNVQVTAYLAATPNKIDSHAMLPDAIVNTTCGKKVEIRHTDAEGRLTLIDAVAMAAREKPDEIVTMATLTGSASNAVGLCIALMGNNCQLEARVQNAAETLGDPIQPLKVIEDDYDNIKSKLDGADIINTSQRKNRGAQSAAAFVMSGAPEGVPMAHMDIAGADMTSDEKATGIGAKTLIRFVLDTAQLPGGAAKAKAVATKKAKKRKKR